MPTFWQSQCHLCQWPQHDWYFFLSADFLGRLYQPWWFSARQRRSRRPHLGSWWISKRNLPKSFEHSYPAHDRVQKGRHSWRIPLETKPENLVSLRWPWGGLDCEDVTCKGSSRELDSWGPRVDSDKVQELHRAVFAQGPAFQRVSRCPR